MKGADTLLPLRGERGPGSPLGEGPGPQGNFHTWGFIYQGPQPHLQVQWGLGRLRGCMSPLGKSLQPPQGSISVVKSVL